MEFGGPCSITAQKIGAERCMWLGPDFRMTLKSWKTVNTVDILEAFAKLKVNQYDLTPRRKVKMKHLVTRNASKMVKYALKSSMLKLMGMFKSAGKMSYEKMKNILKM